MSSTTRLTFLQASALSALAATRSGGTNDRINIAIIDIGGRGRNHIEEYAKQQDAHIYGLCDVDQANLERGIALTNKLTGETPKSFKDMKEVFADKEVHAVSMPLPNHWHAPATVWVCQKTDTGRHVANFLKAVRSRKPEDLHADINVGRISADLCHLANISYHLGGRTLAFDPAIERFADEEANRLAHPNYRAPCVIPNLAS